MENTLSLNDYLKKTKLKRERLIKIADEFLEKVMREEARMARTNSQLRNASKKRNTNIILDPIRQENVTSRVLKSRNTSDVI